MKSVVIFQYRLLHYRLGLFEQMREKCNRQGIELKIVYGQATRRELVRKDEGFLPWAIKVKNSVWEVADRDFIWQPFPSLVKNADLVIVMQESRILSNYPLLISRLWSNRKIAYWGHGINFQSKSPNGFRERWKRLILNRVDWWFAYTQMTVDLLLKNNYPINQITRLDNAIDTAGFKADLAECDSELINQKACELGIDINAPIAIYCGSLYSDKKLELLVESADLIKKQLPSFQLLVIGDGPSMPFMRQAAEDNRPWLHLLGVQKGKAKALFFSMAQIMLNPGLVGLHIVDAFCAGLIMATTNNAKHSPEVAYLKHGINGISTNDTAIEYSQAVIDIFKSPTRLKEMQEAALNDSNVYSLENMVDNFVKGIKSAIES